MTERPKHLHVYKDRHGKQRCYLRRRGRRIPLKEEIGTEAFAAEYEAALKAADADPAPPTGPLIYFVRAGDRVKIGMTTNPISSRVRTMQVGSPVKLHLVATIPGGRQLERQLHSRFSKHRIAGEWFHAADEIRNFLIELRTKPRRPLANREIG